MPKKNPRHHFTVRMTGYRPPFDMMRYDHCWPATEAESVKLNCMMDGDGKPVEVTFATDNPSAPTDGRWASFGCRVLPYDPARDDRGY